MNTIDERATRTRQKLYVTIAIGREVESDLS